MAFRSMAARLGVTETTVQRRTQQLIEAGLYQVIGIVDPLQFGQGHAVIIGISSDPPVVHDVAAALADIPEMRFVTLVTGTFDVVAEMVTSERDRITRMLTEEVPRIPGVRAINTSWILHNYKTNFRWEDSVEDLAVDDEAAEPDDGADPDRELDYDPDGRTPGATGGATAYTRDHELDTLDHDITTLLQRNGRMSYAEMAGRLSITEATARRRTLRLLQSGYVRVVAIGNPFLLGFQEVVLMWFKVELAQVSAVTAALRRLPAVRYLSRTAGAVDVLAEATFRNRSELFAFLDGTLAGIAGIRDVSISFQLKIHKRAYLRFA
jgi:DNA-binding Lrp family transcriptional regulator